MGSSPVMTPERRWYCDVAALTSSMSPRPRIQYCWMQGIACRWMNGQKPQSATPPHNAK
jgi:hypothetical protein